jgi:hypothetical protein
MRTTLDQRGEIVIRSEACGSVCRSSSRLDDLIASARPEVAVRLIKGGNGP